MYMYMHVRMHILIKLIKLCEHRIVITYTVHNNMAVYYILRMYIHMHIILNYIRTKLAISCH